MPCDRQGPRVSRNVGLIPLTASSSSIYYEARDRFQRRIIDKARNQLKALEKNVRIIPQTILLYSFISFPPCVIPVS